MDTPFGTTWQKLTLNTLKRFFDTAADEGRQWDAKSNPAKVSPQGVKRADALKEMIWKAGSAFANEHGGYLVLGANEVGNRWSLPGAEIPGREPHDWISSAVRHLDPPPSFDVRCFELTVGRTVAVIRFDELDQKPCVTPSGVAYRRQGSQSVPADHAHLRKWAKALEQLRARAERELPRRAKASCESLYPLHPTGGALMQPVFEVVLASPRIVPGEQIFDQAFDELLRAHAEDLPLRSVIADRSVIPMVGQHGTGAASYAEDTEAWIVGIARDGQAWAQYLHPHLRPAWLPSHGPREEPRNWRWTKSDEARFVSRAISACEGIVRAVTHAAPNEIGEVFVTLAIPADGTWRRPRGGGFIQPVALASRWRLSGSTARATATELLTEMRRRGGTRPFNGWPPEPQLPRLRAIGPSRKS